MGRRERSWLTSAFTAPQQRAWNRRCPRGSPCSTNPAAEGTSPEPSLRRTSALHQPACHRLYRKKLHLLRTSPGANIFTGHYRYCSLAQPPSRRSSLMSSRTFSTSVSGTLRDHACSLPPLDWRPRQQNVTEVSLGPVLENRGLAFTQKHLATNPRPSSAEDSSG